MLKDITIGQYYPTNSLIHNLDPRVKLFGTMAFVISLFFFKSVLGYTVATLFLAGVIIISKVPFLNLIKGLKAIMIIMLITGLINLFMTPGEVLYELGFLTITKEGIETATLMVLRLVYLIIGSSMMTFTTTPNNLTDGLERSLNWMNKLKVPVHEMAMMMSIALSFIPILMEETDKIMKAQMSRGADFEGKNYIVRVKNMIPLLVPLFISAFRRANDLALAMEARCYRGGEGRTKMKPLVYKRADWIAYAIIVIYLVATITIGIHDKKVMAEALMNLR